MLVNAASGIASGIRSSPHSDLEILEINSLREVNKEVVDAASESLVIAQA
jgi:hypothetical protein